MFIDCGGPVYRIKVGKRNILFEMHSHCGPMPVDADGNGRDFGPQHGFWAAVTDWIRQGQHATARSSHPAADHDCIWKTSEATQ